MTDKQFLFIYTVTSEGAQRCKKHYLREKVYSLIYSKEYNNYVGEYYSKWITFVAAFIKIIKRKEKLI